MSQLLVLQAGIFESLQDLSFNEYVVHRKECKNFILKRDLFSKPDHNAFEIIMMFLVRRLKNSRALAQYRYCYPCLDKNQEAEFRKVTIEFAKSLEKVDPSLKFTPILAVQPGGEAFCCYLLNLINFVMVKVLKDKYGQENELDSNEFRLAEKTEEESLNLDHLKSVYEDLDQGMSAQKYFESRQRSHRSELEAVCFELKEVVNSAHVRVLGVADNSMRDHELIANFKQSVYNLNDEVSIKMTTLFELVERVSLKLEMCNCSSDSCLISSGNRGVDVGNFAHQHHLHKYFSSGLLNLELVNKDVKMFIRQLDSTLENWVSMEECKNVYSHFKFFNQEIEKLSQLIDEKMFDLRKAKESLEKLICCKRRQLLDTPQVQERRKWFSSRVPSSFPELKFVFGDLSSDNLSSDNLTDSSGNGSDMTDSPLSSTPPSMIQSRFIQHNTTAFEWSFHPLDISRFSYVAPAAPEKPILSPLREEVSSSSIDLEAGY